MRLYDDFYDLFKEGLLVTFQPPLINFKYTLPSPCCSTVISNYVMIIILLMQLIQCVEKPFTVLEYCIL